MPRSKSRVQIPSPAPDFYPTGSRSADAFCRNADTRSGARYPSGKGEVCKTFMRRFDSDPRLQSFLFSRRSYSTRCNFACTLIRKRVATSRDCSKYLLNRSRSCNLARNDRLFTVTTLNPSASAVCSSVGPSMALRTKTTLGPEPTFCCVLRKISCNGSARVEILGIRGPICNFNR